MTKRYDEAFATVRNCVARDKIRCLHNDAGQLEYFTTMKGAEILAGVGIHAYMLRTRPSVDAEGHQFGGHVRQLIMEGRGGLLECFKSEERVRAALSGAKVVPLTEEAVAETIADREAFAKRFEDAKRQRAESRKPAYLRARGDISL